MQFTQTPVCFLEQDKRGNRFWMKREDLLPFSFGGNKARIALEYLRDMKAKGANHMVAYGNARSNLCRVLSNLCAKEGIPITLISPADDDGERRVSMNAVLCELFGAKIVPCEKTNVAQTVETVLTSIRQGGETPYYIYGDKFGQGNEAVPTAAYVPVYGEIKAQGTFDIIALACGTGMTQAGLLTGQMQADGKERIIGFSVARDAENAKAHILAFANAYLQREALGEDTVEVCDTWRESYGVYSEDVAQTIDRMMLKFGIPLDGTYTGKAYCAMRKLCEMENWHNQNILFIHTGGTPLFFDRMYHK